MNFKVTHVFREGNQSTDSLPTLRLSIPNLIIWTDLPMSIRECYVKNRLDMPNNKFVIF